MLDKPLWDKHPRLLGTLMNYGLKKAHKLGPWPTVTGRYFHATEASLPVPRFDGISLEINNCRKKCFIRLVLCKSTRAFRVNKDYFLISVEAPLIKSQKLDPVSLSFGLSVSLLVHLSIYASLTLSFSF
jgi:hypothetical protein